MNKFTTLLVPLVIPAMGYAQLSGFYNIGGSTPHYADLGAAFDDLMAQGANGDVTFLVHPGTYTGQADLGAVPGNPGQITVRSSTNDADDVTLAWDAVFPLPNHIVQLEGAANVMFEDVTFHALNEDRARCIHFTGNTDDLKLWDCVFIGSQSTNTNGYSDRVLVHCDQNELNVPDNPDNLQVLNCEFRNGYQAIKLDAEGNGGARAQNLMIAENTMVDQLSLGITVNNGTGTIAMNRITTDIGNSYTGIRTSFFDGGSKIERNTIQAHASISGCTGIEVGNTQNTTGNQIHNNMITVSAATGECWGLGVYNLWDMSIIWNSVAVTDGASTSKAFYHLSNFDDGQDCVIRNNIFANYADGPALESDVAGNIATEDHNDLFSTGTVLAMTDSVEYADLAAYQAGTGDGASDLDLDPAFPFLPDLHLNSCALDGTGEWFPIGLGDIDYEARGNPVCDIGADEYTYSTGTISTELDLTSDDIPYTLTAPAGSGYDWSQGATTQSIEVSTSGTYSCQFTDVNGCTYTVEWEVEVEISTALDEQGPEDIRPWPVPATDRLFIPGVSNGTRYSLHDMDGRTVTQGTVVQGRAVDVSGLAPGMHLIILTETGRVLRFIKQ